MKRNNKLWFFPLLSTGFIIAVIFVVADVVQLQNKVEKYVASISLLNQVNLELSKIVDDVTYLDQIDQKSILADYQLANSLNDLEPDRELDAFLSDIGATSNPTLFFKTTVVINKRIQLIRQDLSDISNALKFRWVLISILGIISCLFAILISYFALQFFQNKRELESKNLELTHAVAVAKRAINARSDFISFLSNEIRTPINAIIGLVQLQPEITTPRDKNHNLQLIKFSAENLHSLVNDILDFGKMESDNLILQNKEFAFKAHFQKIVDTLTPIAHAKNLELLFEFDDRLPDYIESDRTRLSQIAFNLINNAIKFTPDGYVKLQIGMLSISEEYAEVKFSVKDSGIGIPEEKQEFIFERFVGGRNHTNEEMAGTGLGLTITKKLVELFHGEIHLVSKPNKGSTFSFTLQLKIGQTKLKASEITPSILEVKSKKILLVDDNRINRLIISKYLEKTFPGLEHAENGKIALEKLEAKKYDLILMDLQMPEMDGFEATMKIRKKYSAKELPVLAISATSVEVLQKEKYVKSGINDFISKPIDLSDLMQKMLTHL
ncbi:MAG: response regulator [Flavobacteriales bacterium]|nr:response regulator [Flavobacteriales bacterium]